MAAASNMSDHCRIICIECASSASQGCSKGCWVHSAGDCPVLGRFGDAADGRQCESLDELCKLLRRQCAY
eukprot:8059436-Pyramimonas_sp.AAC.1